MAPGDELASDLFAVPSKHGVTQHFRSGPFQTPVSSAASSRREPVFCARVLRPCSAAVYRYLRTTLISGANLPCQGKGGPHPFQPGFGFRLELIPVCPKMVEKGREHLPATRTTR